MSRTETMPWRPVADWATWLLQQATQHRSKKVHLLSNLPRVRSTLRGPDPGKWGQGEGDVSTPDQALQARAITSGPKHHWFGYYDKLQFDPTCRYVLGMEVGFEHRSPAADDVIAVGMVDLQDHCRWIDLGTSRAWCWQQGCMLQWRPGSGSEIVWNDREGDRFVCHVLDVESGHKRTLPHPIYTVSPDGHTAIGTDFRRVNHMRPGYGYAGLPDPNQDMLAPNDAGIYRLDLETGEYELVLTIADVARIPYPHADLSAAKHYFNHLLFNTDGTRFEFLHRWRMEGQPGFGTRMLTATPEGSDMRVIDDYGHTSHFIWRDPSHILAWAWHPSHEWAFYVYEDGSREVEVVGKDAMTQNGHCTYLPGNEWILNDTYPDQDRNQELYLYHTTTGEKVPLARLHSPEAYVGEWRCDLHPRSSSDGRSVIVDSAHGRSGRQMYLVDISSLTSLHR
jgi:hypothetical protein